MHVWIPWLVGEGENRQLSRPGPGQWGEGVGSVLQYSRFDLGCRVGAGSEAGPTGEGGRCEQYGKPDPDGRSLLVPHQPE